MTISDSLALRQRLESLVVGELKSRLESEHISGDRAKEIAQIFLETVPEDISHDELIAAVNTLDDKAGELAGIVYQILSENDEAIREKEIDKVRNLINLTKK